MCILSSIFHFCIHKYEYFSVTVQNCLSRLILFKHSLKSKWNRWWLIVHQLAFRITLGKWCYVLLCCKLVIINSNLRNSLQDEYISLEILLACTSLASLDLFLKFSWSISLFSHSEYTRSQGLCSHMSFLFHV